LLHRIEEEAEADHHHSILDTIKETLNIINTPLVIGISRALRSLLHMVTDQLRNIIQGMILRVHQSLRSMHIRVAEVGVR